MRGTFHPYLGVGRSTGSLVASLNSVASSCCRTGMSELPRRSTRLGGGTNTVENEDPSDESTEALAQRAAEEPRPAQLVSEQGIPANLYPDPGLPLTGPLTAMTKEVVEQSKAEPAAPRRVARRRLGVLKNHTHLACQSVSIRLAAPPQDEARSSRPARP